MKDPASRCSNSDIVSTNLDGFPRPANAGSGQATGLSLVSPARIHNQGQFRQVFRKHRLAARRQISLNFPLLFPISLANDLRP